MVTCLDSNTWLWEGGSVDNVANDGGGGAWQRAGQPAQTSCKLQQASHVHQDGSNHLGRHSFGADSFGVLKLKYLGNLQHRSWL